MDKIPGLKVQGLWALNYPGIKKSRDWDFQNIPGVNDWTNSGILAYLVRSLFALLISTIESVQSEPRKVFYNTLYSKLYSVWAINENIFFPKHLIKKNVIDEPGLQHKNMYQILLIPRGTFWLLSVLFCPIYSFLLMSNMKVLVVPAWIPQSTVVCEIV
jgi:hypothetical protein